MMRSTLIFATTAAAVLSATGADASVHGVLLGIDAPPTIFDGFTMMPSPADPTPLATFVTSAPSALGPVAFTTPVQHHKVGFPPDGSWLTWSHGYTGDVYLVPAAGPSPINTMLLPSGTEAFLFYVCPLAIFQPPMPVTVTAISSSGSMSTLVQSIQSETFPGPPKPGQGAAGFAFSVSAGETLTSITVTAPAPFAVGEFGIAGVPAPSAAVLLVAISIRSRRRK